jgi:glycosyltransferase involved in cell wall biosynthesis
MSASRVAVIIPAYNEQDRIRATVEAARTIPQVSAVVVVDDGSTDDTSMLAREAGAVTVRHRRNLGKAAAMTTGAHAVAEMDAAEGGPRHHLLFLDADLRETAQEAFSLVEPIVDGVADMTIAVLPRSTPGGGHGFVVRLSSKGIERMTGWIPTQPLSGQRCLTRSAFDLLVPLARGFGVETALTIDALQRGLRVAEVPANLAHRVTGRRFKDQLHRARQYRDVAYALAVRAVRRRLTRGQHASGADASRRSARTP